MSNPFYPWYPGDYAKDTQDLSLTEHGAYRLLLDHYYGEKKLPKSAKRLYVICKATKKFERMAVDYIASRFFKDNGEGFLTQKRAEIEILKRDEYIAKQAKKGKKSAEKRWGKDNRGSNRGDNRGSNRGDNRGDNRGGNKPEPDKDLKSKAHKYKPRAGARAREGGTQNPGHFSEAMEGHLEKINQLGREIERDGFVEIWSVIQEWFKKGFHPSLIQEVLEGGAPYIKGKKNQQGYIRAIMKTKAQNWREKGFIQEHEKQQADFKGFIDMLKSFAKRIG